MKKRRVVITGGTGFIGTNLTEYLMLTEPETEIILFDLVPPCITLSRQVRYVYGDIRNLKTLLDVCAGADELYNLAGILGTSELLNLSSLSCETNIVGCCNVLDAAKICGVKNVYNVAKPHFEGYAENAYTLTKHAAELLGIMYREKFQMEVATVRWLNAVGPYQHLYPVRKFVPMMILLAMQDLPLQVYGSGKQTIDPIDVCDLSRFTVHACRNLGSHPDVVDLGSGIAISCNDAAELILMLTSSKLRTTVGRASRSEILHVPMRVGEADDIDLRADMSYWNSVGMQTEVSFETSVVKTIDYIFDLPKYHIDNAMQFYGLRA